MNGGRHRAPAAARTLPLTAPPALSRPPTLPRDVVYGLAHVDRSGRVADRTVTGALGWRGGDRLTLTAEAGVVIIRRDPSGLVTLPPWSCVPIPAALRHRCGLLPGEFEDHLLDRERPWAGTGGKTLPDLGYGFLGQYRRHVKDHINRLLDLGHHTCIADPLEPLLVTTALLYGRHHKGMPRWPVLVERIGILLADPAHAEWGQDGQGVRALAQMPPETPSPEGLTAALLNAPSMTGTRSR